MLITKETFFKKEDIISCKEYSEIRKCNLRKTISNLNNKPTLLVIQVGDNPASNSYIKGKYKDCESVGIEMIHEKYNDNITEEELIDNISNFAKDDKIDGIIVQLPLPKHLDVSKIQMAIPAHKDVDGFRVDSNYQCCTPSGIIEWLLFNGIDLTGLNVVVVGRSNIVGKPLVNYLIELGATVTCCNSHTKNLLLKTIDADIVVLATGKARYFKADYFDDNQLIIDVGINRDKNGSLCGDLNTDNINEWYKNTYYTPVPNGVGLLTRIALLENTLKAYYNKNKK